VRSNGVQAGANGAGGESLVHAGGHAMMDRCGSGSVMRNRDRERAGWGRRPYLVWVNEGPDVCGDPGEGDLPARRGEGETKPGRGDDEAGGVRICAGRRS